MEQDDDSRYFKIDGRSREFRDEVMAEMLACAKAGEMTNADWVAFCESVGIVPTRRWLHHGRPSLDHLPEKFRGMAPYIARDVYVSEVSWAIYTKEYIESLARLLKGKRVLEVCAGRGVLQPLMQARGVDWKSTDAIRIPGENHVITMKADQALEYYDHAEVVFASWVPLGANWDSVLLDKLPLIIVGEVMGCTGGQDFTEAAEKIENKFEPAERFDWFKDVPQWEGIHDFTMVIGDL